MTSRVPALLLGLMIVGLATPAAAEVHASLRPDSVGAPYRYVLELVTDGEAADVVFDRRLLSLRLRVEGRRRPLTCRHPAAPRRVQDSRVVHLDSSTTRVAEWLDLRMYCTGAALDAVRAGASVQARYGFSRGGRTRWVVKAGDARPLRSLDLPEFTLPALTPPPAPTGAIDVTLRSTTVTVGRSPSFRLKLRSDGARRIVYARDDLYRFHIAGPLGEVDCGPDTLEVVPIVDFYQRVSRRGGASARIDSAQVCPDAFSVPGVYEVTPSIDLIYSGERYGLDAVTGRFVGSPALVRVVGRTYVVHPVDGAEAP
jgi:hypothetical protein